MRAALDDLAATARWPARRRARRHARARARRARASTRRSAPTPRDARRRPARHRRPARRARWRGVRAARRAPSPTRRGRRRSSASCWQPGDTVLVKALARRRPRGRRRGAPGHGAAMGEVLIAGTAVAADLHLPRRRSSSSPARPRVRPAHPRGGPEGHHAKAGTPTMGGIIIFAAISVPFLILSDYDWRSVGVFGAAIACALLGFADDYTKIIRRRSLGLRGAHEAGRDGRDLAGAVVRRDQEGRPAGHAAAAGRRRADRPRRLLPGAHLPRGGGDDERA